ncbi:MAG: hypothetical protein EA427_04055 [Spirochaetaceae bacterium]|nr:MAG: hypothetical protein EA427_04055 [Spirochaetaceae bacterium]
MIALLLAGACTTIPREFDPPTEESEQVPEEREEKTRPTPGDEAIPSARPLPTEEHVRMIEKRLPYGTEVLRTEAGPALVFAPGRRIMGLAGTPETLLVFSITLEESRRPFLHAIGDQCTVDSLVFKPVPPMGRDETGRVYHALEALLACPGEEFSLFVLPRVHSPPFIMVQPLSSVSRSLLRDLTGDGFPELLRYSRIFSTEGKRELLVEAFRWDGEDFRILRSRALFAHIDARYDHLEEQLDGPAPDRDFLRRLDQTLKPLDDAPPASSIMPVEWLQLPRLVDTPLRLGEDRWLLDQEISLNGYIYRFQLEVAANPLVAVPVSIPGLDPSQN